jgi:hypothetical protein
MEPQPGTTAPGNANNYDFILNPTQPKKGAGLGFGKDPFITKIIFLVGGAVLLMIVIGVIISLAFGGKTNVDTFVAIAQRQQEIVRVSALSDSAVSQQIKNAAISTEVTIASQQNKTVAYLTAHKRPIAAQELALKKDATVDAKLNQAKETSTFDATFTVVMRAELTTYAQQLKDAYNGKSNRTQRELVGLQYKDVQLLLKQWPESNTTQ